MKAYAEDQPANRIVLVEEGRGRTGSPPSLPLFHFFPGFYESCSLIQKTTELAIPLFLKLRKQRSREVTKLVLRK